MNLASRIGLELGDITQLEVEAVVTAANQYLAGGGGVDGAIHSAAGPQLVVASLRLAPCPAGEARITPGFNAIAEHVIHAVGPIYNDGSEGEAETLGNAYTSSLTLAAQNDIKRIAFPCISTGVYGYPPQEACRVAINAVIEWLQSKELPRQVTFCCFLQTDYDLYRERLDELGLAANL